MNSTNHRTLRRDYPSLCFVGKTKHGVCFAVTSAKFTSTGGGLLNSSKPDTYVEVFVDGVSAKKSGVHKKSNHPSWNETFIMCVMCATRAHFYQMDVADR
jgi:hypothetical protein